MANSSPAVANTQATAVEYNDLRDDVLDNATGHDHEATDGKRLAKNALRFTAAKLLRGAGAAEPTEIDVPDGPTREFFMQPGPVSTGASRQDGDFWAWELNVATEYVLINFKCPHDFTALTHCKVLGIKRTNGTIDWTVTTDFAPIGSAYNTGSDTDTANGLAMTDTEIEEVDISAAFTGLAADDYVGVRFTLDDISAGEFDVIGLVFKYT